LDNYRKNIKEKIGDRTLSEKELKDFVVEETVKQFMPWIIHNLKK